MQAAGRGVATIASRHETTLEVWYRDLALGQLPAEPFVLEADGELERRVRFEVTETQIDLDAPPAGVHGMTVGMNVPA